MLTLMQSARGADVFRATRRDCLRLTPPLTEDIEIAGPIDVKLRASSSALDTDFTAKLINAHPRSADYPERIEMILEDGIIRARFRNSLERAELMNPGEIYQFTIDLESVLGRSSHPAGYLEQQLFRASIRIRTLANRSTLTLARWLRATRFITTPRIQVTRSRTPLRVWAVELVRPCPLRRSCAPS